MKFRYVLKANEYNKEDGYDPLLVCPECKADLTEKNAVGVFYTDGVNPPHDFQTEVEKDGSVNDNDCLIENGLGSGLCCDGCGTDLGEYNDEQTEVEPYPIVVVVKDGIVDEAVICKDDEHAKRVFLDLCAERISNWGDYTVKDIDAVLEQGFEEFGNGSVCLVNP
jgi:hypothetical protein